MKSSGENTEALLVALGGRGRFQIICHVLLSASYIVLVFNHVVMAFHGTPIPHTCAPHAAQEEKKEAFPNSFNVQNLNLTEFSTIGECSSTFYSSDRENKTLQCHSGQWKYSPEYGENNIVSEFDLVCDDKSLPALATSIYFAGVMVGGLVFGDLADRFGRLPVLVFTMLSTTVVGLGTAFSVNYLMFVLLRFVCGIMVQGFQVSGYSMIMELYVAKYRPFAGAMAEVFFSIGTVILAGLAYFLREWRHLQIAISIPGLIAIAYLLFVPESLRWLLATGKIKKADTVVKRICKFNKIPNADECIDKMNEFTGTNDTAQAKARQFNISHLFRTPRLRSRTLILFYIWFAIACSYFGVTFKLSSLKVDRFLMFVISGIIEAIIFCSSILIMNRFGRKKPLMVGFFIAAVTCIGSGMVNVLFEGQYLLSAMLALVGRGSLAFVFGTVFVYTSELYPTVIRNIGIGACNFFARLGGSCAPQIELLASTRIHCDVIILFGAMCVIALLLFIPLPETHNTKMADSIEDVEGRDGITTVEMVDGTHLISNAKETETM